MKVKLLASDKTVTVSDNYGLRLIGQGKAVLVEEKKAEKPKADPEAAPEEKPEQPKPKSRKTGKE